MELGFKPGMELGFSLALEFMFPLMKFRAECPQIWRLGTLSILTWGKLWNGSIGRTLLPSPQADHKTVMYPPYTWRKGTSLSPKTDSGQRNLKEHPKPGTLPVFSASGSVTVIYLSSYLTRPVSLSLSVLQLRIFFLFLKVLLHSCLSTFAHTSSLCLGFTQVTIAQLLDQAQLNFLRKASLTR